MSVREEDRKNNNCSNRGLGIAAAAIGVGVGAALYYIFSKRTENPAEDGATSSTWSAEQHALHDSSYSTISEHSTTDTSINSSSNDIAYWIPGSNGESDSDSSSEDDQNSRGVNQSDTESNSSSSEDDPDFSSDGFHQSDSESDRSFSSMDVDDDQSNRNSNRHDVIPMSEGSSDEYNSIQSDDATNMEFDVTSSSVDVPTDRRSGQRSRTPMMRQFGELTVRLRNRVENRERSWALEQCSICFDMMQRDHEVLSLACTHRFHQACILPWLEQQQTCPVCRKAT